MADNQMCLVSLFCFALFNERCTLNLKYIFPLGYLVKKRKKKKNLSYSAAVSLEEIGITTHNEFYRIHHPQVSALTLLEM